MKFIRLGEIGGAATPGVFGSAGEIRDISALTADITPQSLSGGLIEAVQQTDLSTLPKLDPKGRRIAPPVSQPPNIWCIGLNYSDHAKEAGMAIPEEPILFNKSSATYCGPNDDIYHTPDMTKLDWEVELGIVIKKTALKITKDEAMDYVFGFVTVNDVSERAWQLDRGGQWVKGKSFPNFCPVGPYLVTPDSLEDVNNLAMQLSVNGARMQTGSTANMIFDVPTIVAYMSEFCQLQPGDLICTGTPPGVGAGMTPPQYLKPGDKVTLSIDGLGAQAQTVIDYV